MIPVISTDRLPGEFFEAIINIPHPDHPERKKSTCVAIADKWLRPAHYVIGDHTGNPLKPDSLEMLLEFICCHIEKKLFWTRKKQIDAADGILHETNIRF